MIWNPISSPVVFSWRQFLPFLLDNIWQYLETFLVVTPGGGSVMGILWVEDRGAAKHPAKHMTVPTTKNSVAPALNKC